MPALMLLIGSMLMPAHVDNARRAKMPAG